MIGLTRALALEVARRGVTVNAVCPGYTETEFIERAVAQISAKTGRSADEARAELVAVNPQGRLVHPKRSRRSSCGSAGANRHRSPGRRSPWPAERSCEVLAMNAVPGEVNDLESRVIDDHHQAVKLWLRLLACTTRVETVVRSRLRSEFGTTLPRFDLLAQLEREPEGLTMGELSAALDGDRRQRHRRHRPARSRGSREAHAASGRPACLRRAA